MLPRAAAGMSDLLDTPVTTLRGEQTTFGALTFQRLPLRVTPAALQTA